MKKIAHHLQIRTLASRPTIAQNECCDLKLEDESGDRWWLCRLPVGETDHRIIIERHRTHLGGWYRDTIFTDPEEKS